MEAWTSRGLTRFVVDVASRPVHIAGTREKPYQAWMLQMARNLTDPDHGFLKGKRVLIHGREPSRAPNPKLGVAGRRR